MVVLHTAIAIAVIVLLIIKAKVDPVISLIIGSLYLGIATGVGLTATLTAIAAGFGEIMGEVGLLIGFGVLIGAMLLAMGAFKRMVRCSSTVSARTGSRTRMTAAMSTIFPSIYVDVQVVLASPVARSTAPFIGPTGLPLMAGALGAGIFAGYVFVIPGLAAVSIAGLLEIPLGTWLLYGLVLGPLTAIVTTLIFRLLLRGPYWNPTKDEDVDEAMVEQETTRWSTTTHATPPLLVCLLPILVPLVMIAFGAFAEPLEFSNEFIAFLGDADLALFVGLLGAYVLCRRTLGSDGTDAAMSKGFHTTGAILLITGIGGSLGAVIRRPGSTRSWPTSSPPTKQRRSPSASCSPGSSPPSCTWRSGRSRSPHHSRRDHRPGPASIDVSPVVIGLAIGAGALFALQVNSNFFWMYQSLLGLSTQGTLQDPDIGHLLRLGRVVAHGHGGGTHRVGPASWVARAGRRAPVGARGCCLGRIRRSLSSSPRLVSPRADRQLGGQVLLLGNVLVCPSGRRGGTIGGMSVRRSGRGDRSFLRRAERAPQMGGSMACKRSTVISAWSIVGNPACARASRICSLAKRVRIASSDSQTPTMYSESSPTAQWWRSSPGGPPASMIARWARS